MANDSVEEGKQETPIETELAKKFGKDKSKPDPKKGGKR